MKHKEIIRIRHTLIPLNGRPLRFVFRAADMLCLQFGDIVEKYSLFKEHDELIRKKEQAGEYSLHIQCFYRIICGDRIVLVKNDRFSPSSAVMKQPSFDIDNFDFDKIGNNRLDENITLLRSDLDDFIINAVKVTSFGDIFIKFANGFVLEAYIDTIDSGECWRFFKNSDNDRHFVVTGTGIESQDDE